MQDVRYYYMYDDVDGVVQSMMTGTGGEVPGTPPGFSILKSDIKLDTSSLKVDVNSKEFVEVVIELSDEEKLENALALRATAYKNESDPLYMEWQYDQTEESGQAWRDKVLEIKLRYPLYY